MRVKKAARTPFHPVEVEVPATPGRKSGRAIASGRLAFVLVRDD